MALSVTHLSTEAAHPQQLKQPVLLPRLLWHSRASRPLLPGDERLAAAQGTRLMLYLASSGGRNTLAETLHCSFCTARHPSLQPQPAPRCSRAGAPRAAQSSLAQGTSQLWDWQDGTICFVFLVSLSL